MTDRLVVQDLSKHYGNFVALAPTDLTLRAGETVILSGQNGSGKDDPADLHCEPGEAQQRHRDGGFL